MHRRMPFAGIGVMVLVLALAGAALALSDGGGNDDGSAVAPSPTTPTPPAGTPSPDQPIASTPKPVQPTQTPPSSGTQPPAPTATPSLPADREAVRAPIDALDVRVLESAPPQYMLHVRAGLPSGCAQKYLHTLSRSGDTFTVTVLNSMPKGNPICTLIYGMYELNINLGSDFTAGRTYTVNVNDKSVSFTAQ
jgi:hypothetical protein